MASVVGICNGALQRLGAARITSLDNATKNARECNAAYERRRDTTLRRHRWSFASQRASLAADSTAPAFGPANYFTLPTDCLRVLLPDEVDTDWAIEGRKIATDWGAPLEIRYIARITDPNTMDPMFREALSIDLALTLCEVITGSNQKAAGLRDEMRDVLAEAKRVNGIELPAGELREDDWLTARL